MVDSERQIAMAQDGLLIGQVSRLTGASIRTIRHYEAKELLKARRRPSRYRLFEEKDIMRLKLVRRLRRLGFSISETKQVLPILLDQSPSTQRDRRLKTLLKARLFAAKEQLGELAKIHKELEERLKLLPAKTKPSKAGCCEPFCGPETCGPGFLPMAQLPLTGKQRRRRRMRRNAVVLGLLLILGAVAPTILMGMGEKPLAQTKAGQMEKLTLKCTQGGCPGGEGFCCLTDQRRLQQALLKPKGVSQVIPDETNRTFSVIYPKGEVLLADLKRSASDAGFEVTVVD